MALEKTIFFIDVGHNSSARGAVKNEQVFGIVCDIKIYTLTMKAAMRCSYPILKTLGLLFER